MPKVPGKAKKQMKAKRAAPSFDEQLKARLSEKNMSPTEKLIMASQLWGQDEAAEPDFFAAIKPFLDGLGSKEGAGATEDEELIALYDEYNSKTDKELMDEVKLLANGVISKQETRALKEASVAERKRFLFVRVLIIAMEAEEDGEGEEADDDADGGGDDIDEAYIAALTEEQCAEREQPDDDEQQPSVSDLTGWLCGLPTAERLAECCAGVNEDDGCWPL